MVQRGLERRCQLGWDVVQCCGPAGPVGRPGPRGRGSLGLAVVRFQPGMEVFPAGAPLASRPLGLGRRVGARGLLRVAALVSLRPAKDPAPRCRASFYAFAPLPQRSRRETKISAMPGVPMRNPCELASNRSFGRSGWPRGPWRPVRLANCLTLAFPKYLRGSLGSDLVLSR